MSEVVPLPSFGEVFFDERGQERVLRVTWHEGTLVLSLWRGEMCTASFRMPMNDVGRLVDTLDEGFVEAGGQYPDEVGETTGQGGYQDPNGFPGTGQYARPAPEDYASPPQQYTDPAATQVVPAAEEPRPAALSPTDVLVARGAVPPVERPPAGYGPDGVVPRENMIVNDSLSYGQPAEQAGHGQAEPVYQMPGDLYPPQQPAAPYGGAAPQGYGAQPQDPYGAARQPDPYATAPAHQPDPYGGPAQQADPYAAAPVQQPDPFAQQPDPFAPQNRPDPYGVTAPAPLPADPYASQGPGQRSGQRPADPYVQAGTTDPSGFPAHSYPQAQPDPYGYPAPAQPDPYAFGARQAGHPADLRDLYGPQGYQEQPVYQEQQTSYQEPPAYQQDVDPSDPLGIFGGQQQDRRSRSRSQESPHSTGERLRPEHEERRDW
ncbi:hypothetical protein ABZ470_13800 [Streptosporangium sp. NPDC020072]|uniref:Uncharacterized protein n=1 Tax=Streptosporangium jomthongense TaxID=1193683 RepID=A0ABV8FCY1_9ACTN